MVMNWNRDELAQWALAHAQREDDALALEAYRRRVRRKICTELGFQSPGLICTGQAGCTRRLMLHAFNARELPSCL